MLSILNYSNWVSFFGVIIGIYVLTFFTIICASLIQFAIHTFINRYYKEHKIDPLKQIFAELFANIVKIDLLFI